MTKKHAKTWTRNVFYISIFQVFNPTDVEIKVSKWFLSSTRRWSDLVISSGTMFREVFVVLLTIADLAMTMPLATWNLIDFRVAEKEEVLQQHLFAQPWWSRLWSACLAIRRISKVISRKQIGQTTARTMLRAAFRFKDKGQTGQTGLTRPSRKPRPPPRYSTLSPTAGWR